MTDPYPSCPGCKDNLGYKSSIGVYPSFPQSQSKSDGESESQVGVASSQKLPHAYEQRPVSATVDEKSSKLRLIERHHASSSEKTTSDQGFDSTNMVHSIIIGYAEPKYCKDRNVRPPVWASLNSMGAVCAYMPGRHAKKGVAFGDVQIRISDVVFSADYQQFDTSHARLQVIRTKLRNLANNLEHTSPGERRYTETVPDTPLKTDPSPISKPRKRKTTVNLANSFEGIPVGRPKPKYCRNPKHPPIIYATLNSVDALITYMPGSTSVKLGATNRSQVHMDHTPYDKEYDSISRRKRTDFIKGKLKEAMKVANVVNDEVDNESIGMDKASMIWIIKENGWWILVENQVYNLSNLALVSCPPLTLKSIFGPVSFRLSIHSILLSAPTHFESWRLFLQGV